MKKRRNRERGAMPACAAVIGQPVGHSLSPVIFRFLSRKCGQDLAYHALEIAPRELWGLFEALRAGDSWKGCNVTIPHKRAAFESVDQLSPTARLTGAVNVIETRKTKRGTRLIGHNTDVFGVEQTLREHGIELRGHMAVIFGAGGAARAAAVALAQRGAREIAFAARKPAQARQLCRELGAELRRVRFTSFRTAEAPGDAAIFINATPLGMTGFPANRLLPRDARPGAWAFDLIYRPERTSFLIAAEKRGLHTVNGLDMLIWQALGTWSLWFGRLPAGIQTDGLKTALKRRLRKELRK